MIVNYINPIDKKDFKNQINGLLKDGYQKTSESPIAIIFKKDLNIMIVYKA